MILNFFILVLCQILIKQATTDGPDYFHDEETNATTDGSDYRNDKEINSTKYLTNDYDDGEDDSPISNDEASKGQNQCNYENEPTCGLSDISESAESFGRIIGEKTVREPKEFPWFVLLIFRHPQTTIKSHCGGTIINSRWILSAAHCRVNASRQLYSLVRIKPMMYKWNSNSTKKKDIEFIKDKILYPDEYIENGETNCRFDMLLIKTKKPIEFHQEKKPICRCANPLQLVDKKNCFVAGFGITHQHKRGPPKHLKKAKVKIVNKTCPSKMVCASGKWIGNRSDKNSGKHFSKKQHVGSCSGDSGSGLVCLLQKNPSRFAIVGTVSYNDAEGPEDEACGWGGSPTKYASIQFLHDWINRMISKNKESSANDLPSPLSEVDEWGMAPTLKIKEQLNYNLDLPFIVLIQIQHRRNKRQNKDDERDDQDDEALSEEIDDDNQRYHRCTGTLLTNKWVITTASCVGLNRSPDDIRIFGVTDYKGRASGSDEKAGQTIRSLTVKKIIIHSNFNPKAEMSSDVDAAYDDLALLKIQELDFFETSMAPASWRPDAEGQIKNSECFIGRQTENVDESFVYLKRTIKSGQSCRLKNDILEYCADKPKHKESDGHQHQVLTEDNEPDCSTGQAGGPLMCRLRSDPGQSMILAGVVKSDIGCSLGDQNVHIFLNSSEKSEN